MASKEAADNVGYYSPSGSEGTAIQGTSNNEMTTMHEEKVEMPGVENMSNVDASGLKRDLHLRHMVMIAISGTIGTGLFLTSGKTIATAGPLGARKYLSCKSKYIVTAATHKKKRPKGRRSALPLPVAHACLIF